MLSETQYQVPLEDLRNEIQSQMDQCNRSIQETNQMLEQSRAELGRLTQRNAAITGHIQQMQPQLENLARTDIKLSYTNALDALQRLLLLRAQMEKMQAEQVAYQKQAAALDRITSLLTEIGHKTKTGEGKQTLEMVMDAQEAERKRLSNSIHDGPAQTLSNLIVQVEIVTKLFDMDKGRARQELGILKESARATLQKVRSFIAELRPMMLDDLGIFPTLEHYLKAYHEDNQVEVNYHLNGQARRLEPYLEVMIFRAVQELVGNSFRFNQDDLSHLKIDILIVIKERQISVAVSDNGRGFSQDPTSIQTGLGLKLIRKRVDALGGQLRIESKPGQGTVVSFEVPCLELEPSSKKPNFILT